MVRRVIWMLGALVGSAVFLAVFWHWASPVTAQGLIIVNPGGSIQAAIDGAAAGDTILITAGRYTESLTLNKAVSLTGVSSATTILRAEPYDRVLTVTGAAITEQVVISGLMVTGGLLNPTGNGGGVLLLDSAHPSFINVLFYNNYAENGGGLWDEVQGSTLYFTGTSFVENYGDDVGGALYIGDGVVVGGRFIRNNCFGSHSKCAGGAIDGDTLAISGTTFISNSARTGGAIFSWNATITNSFFSHNFCALWSNCHGGAIRVVQNMLISSTTFLSNVASSTGGAIFSGGTADILNSSIIGNTCTSEFCWGGGLYVSSLGRITGTTFSDNTSGGLGGGVFAWRNLVVSDSVVTDNSAGEGGGVYIGGLISGTKKIVNSSIEENECVAALCDGGGVWVSGTIAITGTTFTSNTAEGGGGGLWAEHDAVIYDSVFSGNTAVENFGAMGVGMAMVVGGRFEDNHCTQANGCYGGAIGAGDLTMMGTEVVSNSATLIGGGVFAINITATNSLFAYNRCLTPPNCHAGAVYGYINLIMSGTTFLSNTAVDAGGAIVTFSMTRIFNSHFTGNRCLGSSCLGGGIYVSPEPGTSSSLSNTVFSDNVASFGGGGVYAEGELNIFDSQFRNNRCVHDDCWGGGLLVYGPLTLSRSVFFSNTAAGNGSALFVWHPPTINGREGSDDSVVLVNNLFADNPTTVDNDLLFFHYGAVEMVHNTIAASTPVAGHAIYVLGGSADITNTIITSHAVGIVSEGGIINEDYNLYYGNGVDLMGPVTSGGSSIFGGDPDFVEPAGGDFHIGSGSAGLDNGLDVGVVIDLDGNVRPFGAGPDRGAYEFVGQQPVVGLSAENDSPTTLGNATQLTATITAGSNVTYSWDFGDGAMGNGAAVSHVYPGVGVYTAVVTASNSLNMMTATTVVVVEDVPIAGLVIVSNSPVQLGEAVVLTASISAGTNVSYSWAFGDGAAAVGQVVSHTYGTAGSYPVTVTATNGAGEVVATAVVVVLDKTTWAVYLPVALKP